MLADFGFDTDAFGRGTIRLRSVPAPFGRAADVDAFRDAVDTLAVGDEPDALRREVARDIACHHSVRAGDSLDSEQIQLLLDRLDECEQPFHCPHGRPTVLSIDEATLAAGFDRRDRR
ncbi:MAG: DNA mismatch repair enzyme (putative ATPase) [Halorubrum sp. J07HR59]|nr:MAG: DNA mismatch repair enzyme (putative ATPase) [Halorubrum sp. J07HR59]